MSTQTKEADVIGHLHEMFGSGQITNHDPVTFTVCKVNLNTTEVNQAISDYFTKRGFNIEKKIGFLKAQRENEIHMLSVEVTLSSDKKRIMKIRHASY